jgi:hypothetical protein
MDRFIIPDAVVADLARLENGAQLFDAAGHAVGYYVPIVNPSLYQEVGPDLSSDELRIIEQSDEWYSTDDVLRRFEETK